MEDVVSILRVFPFNPISALVISGAFAFSAYISSRNLNRKKYLIAVSLAWGLYAAWEIYMLGWRSPTGDHAIRVDMVFLVPLMLGITVAGLVKFSWGAKSDASDN